MRFREDAEDEFYIGYAAGTPRRLARFRRRAVLSLALMAPCVAGGLGWAFGRFTPANFEFGAPRHFSGVLEEIPVPTLAMPRPGQLPVGTEASTYLLVGAGKRGAGDAISGLEGREVTFEGTLFYAGGQTGIELVRETLIDRGAAPPSAETPQALGRVSVEGEVVDTKCYFGVMNPGWGKVHKSCAFRCLSGGVPPGLLVRVSKTESIVLLLTGGDVPLGDSVLSFAGERVLVEGFLLRRGDHLELQVEPSSFRIR